MREKRARVCIDVDEEMLACIDRIASVRGVDRREVIMEAVAEYLRRYGGDPCTGPTPVVEDRGSYKLIRVYS